MHLLGSSIRIQTIMDYVQIYKLKFTQNILVNAFRLLFVPNGNKV